MKNDCANRLLGRCSFVLLCFLCCCHLLAMIALLMGASLLSAVLPSAFLLSLMIDQLLNRRQPAAGFESWLPGCVSLLVIILSFFVAGFYFDLSWDGQWYHQAAIYGMADGWNPLLQPVTGFDGNNDLSILHFPKGSWYYAAAAFRLTGNPEAGKSMNLVLLFAACFTIYATVRNGGLKRVASIAITGLLLLNPVVWSEITTYLVDGLLYLYLTIYAVTILSWIRTRAMRSLLISSLAAIGLINVKFTGLVFWGMLALATFGYIACCRRTCLRSFFVTSLVTVVLGAMVLGFNPYITNTLQRGHPFYPIMGTEKYPSVFEQTGKDANELYETPQNMRGKSIIQRFYYAHFGKPGNAPYNKEKDAVIIWPFTASVKDWKVYQFHEARISGFGPFFSGILLLSMLLAVVLLFNRQARWKLLLSLTLVCCTLCISKHFWWPRLAPQCWWIPLLPVILCICVYAGRNIRVYAWTLAGLIGINAIIVLYVHLKWETHSSVTLRKQLAAIRQRGTPIEIDYGWFKKSIEEKLKKEQIQFIPVERKLLKKQKYEKLISVVEGYPNMVIYR